MHKSDSKFKHPFSPGTVNRHLQVLSRILLMAYENGIVDSNPMSRVKRIRKPEPGQRYLNQHTDNEFKLDLNAGFSGGNLAALLAAKFLHSVRQHRPELLTGTFKQPGGVNRRRINSRGGCATDGGDAEEYFIAGREPAPCLKR